MRTISSRFPKDLGKDQNSHGKVQFSSIEALKLITLAAEVSTEYFGSTQCRQSLEIIHIALDGWIKLSRGQDIERALFHISNKEKFWISEKSNGHAWDHEREYYARMAEFCKHILCNIAPCSGPFD